MSSPVIDADGHVSEALDWVIDAVEPAIRPFAPRFERRADGTLAVAFVEGRPWRPTFEYQRSPKLCNLAREPRPGGTDPHARLRVLDSEGIDIAVLFPSLGLLYGLYHDGMVAGALCRANNDWMARYCSAEPRRLVGVAVLPQQDPALAAAELRRAVEQHGFVGGMIRPNRSGGRTIDAPDFEPLWLAAADLDVPVVLHEGWMGGGPETLGQDRARGYGGGHVLSHPFEQMAAMLAVATTGVLHRHPALRLGFFEAGCGWAPYWQQRIESHVELFADEFLAGDPTGLLNRRCWLTTGGDEVMLEAVAEAGWADNLCFASDYPHLDAAYPGAVDALRARALAPALESKLLGGNALHLYGERLRHRISDRVTAC